MDILNPSYNHAFGNIGNTVNSDTTTLMRDYFQNSRYKKTILADGHVKHDNILFKVEPQPSQNAIDAAKKKNSYVLNNVLYKMKDEHTIYNFTEEELIHHIAYANQNKKLLKMSDVNIRNNVEKYGKSTNWIETTYESQTIDGISIELKKTNYFRYNKRNQYYYNHISYVKFKF